MTHCRIHASEILPARVFGAVIFDMDGVLADTQAFHLESWVRLAAAHASPGTTGADETSLREIAARTFGQTNDLILPVLWRHLGLGAPRDIEALSREKEAYYREAARGRLVPLPGLARFLDWIHYQGLPLAIGTSGPEENVEFLLDEFGWRGRFDVLVHRACFARGKPAPDCFLRAAEKLRLRPESALVVEDSIHGLRAARRGRFPALAVATTCKPEALRPHARFVVGDFREIACGGAG